MRHKQKQRRNIIKVTHHTPHKRSDYLAVEEPLELRLNDGQRNRLPLTLTMRTPGHDFELAAGFLFAEGIIKSHQDIQSIRYCVEDADEQHYNSVNIRLNTPLPDLSHLNRNFYSSSACGVCGKAGLESLGLRGLVPLADGACVASGVLTSLSERVRAAQGVFEVTGGLHAAALFSASGEVLCVREDIGRHNAVDKVIGWALLNAQVPLHACVLFISGRGGYEIIQKALVAGIPVVVGVSAPSSLAVQLARAFNQTLVGFMRDETYNVYSAEQRICFE